MPVPPGGYARPYYAPAGATVPVHRTPWLLIIAGIVALTVVMAGCGTALAILSNRGSTSAPGTFADVTSPTPGLTPSPIASPTTTTTSGPQTVSNNGETVTVPGGWSVDNNDSESIALSDPRGEGAVTISSGVSIPTQTAQQNKETIDSALKSKYPDTQNCAGSKPASGTFNGASGISWTLCFTATGGAGSTQAAASLFAGANASGTVYYVVMVLTSQSSLQSYLNTVKPVLQSVHWKLS